MVDDPGVSQRLFAPRPDCSRSPRTSSLPAWIVADQVADGPPGVGQPGPDASKYADLIGGVAAVPRGGVAPGIGKAIPPLPDPEGVAAHSGELRDGGNRVSGTPGRRGPGAWFQGAAYSRDARTSDPGTRTGSASCRFAVPGEDHRCGRFGNSRPTHLHSSEGNDPSRHFIEEFDGPRSHPGRDRRTDGSGRIALSRPPDRRICASLESGPVEAQVPPPPATSTTAEEVLER